MVFVCGTSGWKVYPTEVADFSWADCCDQLMRELETAGQAWTAQWHQLHEEETAALATIDQLHRNAREMNICFHQQVIIHNRKGNFERNGMC